MKSLFLRRKVTLQLAVVVAPLFALATMHPAAAGAATYSITTLLEDETENGNCTLREALLAASTDTTSDLCAGDVDPDTIVLEAPGTYILHLGGVSSAGRGLLVRGGAGNPASAYVIDLGSSQRFVEVTSGSTLTLENLTLTNGFDATRGGVLSADDSDVTLKNVIFANSQANDGGAVAFRTAVASHQLDVSESVFSGNMADADQARGGGLFVDLQAGGSVRIVASRFANNSAESVTGTFAREGGGLYLASAAESDVELRHLEFLNNVVDAPSGAAGAGARIVLSNQSGGSIDIEDAAFSNNSFIVFSGSNQDAGLSLVVDGGSVAVRRVRLMGNLGGATRSQAGLSLTGAAQAVVSDLAVGNGDGWGLFLATSGTSTLLAGNLTVAGNPDSGLILAQGGGALRVENSIVFGNATASGSNLETFSGTPDISAENLIGVDPAFADAANGDFRLGGASAAADAGNQTFLSVGPFDAGHGARVVGVELDLGALERGALFNDDFERNELYAWSSFAP